MKKSLITLLILCFATASFAQEKINWVTFEQAIELSKKEPRKIFVDVYTNWCGWCKKMDAASFQDPRVVKYMNKKYYCIKFNAEGRDSVVFPNKTYTNTGRNHELAIELLDGKMSYPTVVYLYENFSKIQAIPGYRDAVEFLKVSSFFGDEIYKTQTWDQYNTSFDVTKF